MSNTRRQFLRAVAAAGLGSLAGCSGASTTETTAELTAASGWPSVCHDGRNTNHNPDATPPSGAPRVVWRTADHTRISDAAQTRYLGGVPRPVVADGRLFLGGRGLTCHDAATGDRLWRREHDDRFVVGLAVTGDRLCAVERRTSEAGGNLVGSLSVVDPATGRRTHTTGCRRLPSTPVTDGDSVVVPTERGHVGFDSSGVRRWDVRQDSPFQPYHASMAAFTDDSLCLPLPDRLGAYDSRLGLLDSLQQTPDERWRFGLGNEQRLRTPTAVADDVLVPVWHQSSPTVSRPPTVQPGLHAYGRDGTHRWRLPLPTALEDGDVEDLVSDYRISTPAVADGVGYVLSSWTDSEADDSEADTTAERERARRGTRLRAFDVADGTERWHVSLPGYGGLAVPPVVADGRVYAAVSGTGPDRQPSRLVAHDRSGDRLWRVELPSRVFHLAAVGDLLYVTLRDRVVAYGPA